MLLGLLKKIFQLRSNILKLHVNLKPRIGIFSVNSSVCVYQYVDADILVRVSILDKINL